ncbi:sterol carrier family protein [Arcanobacterium buesumense]|uniref:Bacterial SCP orthologue domain-containing protein n=1 Tax=Arcanobacterium buesumense TaxID=2722751 RepID=A0A6H2EI46_9ACTO|nr:sterol carrier family protein [Arcanobacterium buesumense]QJC21238.1 hypothetical protein HC352_01010 [Arcanobacterium buesumense]
MKRKVNPAEGLALVRQYVYEGELPTPQLRTAVRFALEEFASRHPGRSVEIRIPWIGAVQAVAGPVHTRGTPPNVVEMDGPTWLNIVTGQPAGGVVQASGARADVMQYLPLFGPGQLGQEHSE